MRLPSTNAIALEHTASSPADSTPAAISCSARARRLVDGTLQPAIAAHAARGRWLRQLLPLSRLLHLCARRAGADATGGRTGWRPRAEPNHLSGAFSPHPIGPSSSRSPSVANQRRPFDVGPWQANA